MFNSKARPGVRVRATFGGLPVETCHPCLRGRVAVVTTHAEAPDEAGREETVTLARFRSGPHTLVSRTIDGNYSDWRQVGPREMVASVSVAESSRAGLVGWLRGLRERDASVTLSRANATRCACRTTRPPGSPA